MAAADLLGHSSISVTGDLCGHTSDDMARAAVDGLGARWAMNGRSTWFGYGTKKAAPDFSETASDLQRTWSG